MGHPVHVVYMNTRTYRVNQNIYARLCRKNAERSTVGESKKIPSVHHASFLVGREIRSPNVKEKRRDVTEQEWLR